MRFSLTLLLCCLGLYKAEATVIFTDIPDELVQGFASDVFFPVDIDGNGVDDFIFLSDGSPSGFDILPQGSNRVFATPDGVSSVVTNFEAGDLIGPNSETANSVLTPLMSLGIVLLGEEVVFGPSLGGCANSIGGGLVCFGPFFSESNGVILSESGFVGVEFDIDGETHFGFIEATANSLNGGVVFSFAFESDPNTAIAAGAVPEPSCACLLGLLVMFGLRRRRQ